MRCALALCLSIAVVPTDALANATLDGEVFTFGIVPQQSASRLAQMWGPFLSELSAQTGATFQFQTTKDIPTFEACLTSGAYDIAYMNPMHWGVWCEHPKSGSFVRSGRRVRSRLCEFS